MVKGQVWIDNGDGLRQNAEPPIDTQVALVEGGGVIASQTTVGGLYTFTVVNVSPAARTLVVSVTLPGATTIGSVTPKASTSLSTRSKAFAL